MFDKDRFVEDVRTAMTESEPQRAVSEVVSRAISDPAAVIEALGPPGKGRSEQLYVDDTLTISNVIWGSSMWVPPHDHTMWAVIGIYTGREDNIFWRRHEHGIEAAGAKALSTKDAAPLGRDIIHSVTNPIERMTGAYTTASSGRSPSASAATRTTACSSAWRR